MMRRRPNLRPVVFVLRASCGARASVRAVVTPSRSPFDQFFLARAVAPAGQVTEIVHALRPRAAIRRYFERGGRILFTPLVFS